ncbi:MAG: tetratricopeptide repeat protein, partial [Candidatus Competibacteraceae bacterium]|nr:tetratricopeptide repeat protein [Candidatus Competibacteraceae bacterium]
MPVQQRRQQPAWLVSSLIATLLLVLSSGVLTGCSDTTPASGTEHLERALAYQQRGELQAAIIEARNALRGAPDDAQIQLLLGRLYLETGRFAEAERALRQARRLDPTGRNWRVPMAQVYLGRGESRRLLDELQADLYDPASVRVNLLALRGQAHLELGELAQARQTLGQVLVLDPEHQETRLSLAALESQAGNLGAARRWVEEVLSDQPDHPQALFLQGQIAQASRDPTAAVAAYDRALTLWPEHGGLKLARVEALLAQGRYDQALAALQPLKAERNLLLSVYYLEAVVAVLRQDNEAAWDLLEQILAASPDHPQSRFLAGVVHYRLGQITRAVAEL